MCHPLEGFQRNNDAPTATTDLVDRICHERTRLEAVLKTLPPDRLAEKPGGGGWALSDHLQHLTAWRRDLLDVLQGRLSVADFPAGPAFDFTPDSNLPISAVLNEFRGVHLNVLAEITLQPDEALSRLSGVNDLTMGELISACTWAHDRRHREALSTDEYGSNGFSLV